MPENNFPIALMTSSIKARFIIDCSCPRLESSLFESGFDEAKLSNFKCFDIENVVYRMRSKERLNYKDVQVSEV